MKQAKVTRRQLLGTAAVATTAFSIIPAHVLGENPPSEKLNLAFVGYGGRGSRNVKALIDQNCVALCETDSLRAEMALKEIPKAKIFRDYRVMLDKMGDEIDGVAVSTPDHTHAAISMEAMRRGKHVYTEKPLAHSIGEARRLREAAKKYGVQTQMGNQGHSAEHIRLMCEWIWAGAIGNIKEVHTCSNRLNAGRFALGEMRPTEKVPVPETFDWDLWLGPASARSYHTSYMSGKWRSWIDFGTGALGDMGCHILDPAFWALKLGEADTYEIQAETTTQKDATLRHTFPTASTIRYKFPARGNMPPVTLTWYDGGRMPEHPKDLEPGRKLNENGAVLVGSNGGSIIHGSHGARGMRIIPEVKMREYMDQRPEPYLPRVKGGHHGDWLRACKDGKPTSGSFQYGGPLTEMVLAGTIAVRRQNKNLVFDTKNMKILNDEAANAMLDPTRRPGWSL